MKVFVCSPFRGTTPEEQDRNVAYACAAGRDSALRGESPLVPHLYLTRFLDDGKPEERYAGMAAGREWLQACDLVVAYMDRGTSVGMQAEITLAMELGIPINCRYLPGWA